MVENIVSTYKCPFCDSNEISEKDIDIVGAAGNTVNIDMHCTCCNKHFMAKTEVMQIELWNVWTDKLAQIQQWLQALKGKLGWNIEIDAELINKEENTKNSIKDEQIVDLNTRLSSKGIKIQDLFWE